jgi:uncharacterized peroxidase-related enzyme
VSWTRIDPPDTATEPLKGVYARIKSHASHGRISQVWQSIALDPRGLDALFTARAALLDEPAPLSTAQAELIAVVVSATNGCAYCVAHHGPHLARALDDERLARAVAMDYREANLAARDRVLLDYAVALTCEPAERNREDIERVREYGFDDAGVVKATEIAAWYNLVNRVVCALGVGLEPGVEPWEFGEQR